MIHFRLSPLRNYDDSLKRYSQLAATCLQCPSQAQLQNDVPGICPQRVAWMAVYSSWVAGVAQEPAEHLPGCVCCMHEVHACIRLPCTNLETERANKVETFLNVHTFCSQGVCARVRSSSIGTDSIRSLVSPAPCSMAFPYLTCEDADRILESSVPWDTYTTARLITEKDLALIRRYDKRSEEMRSSMLDEVINQGRNL